MPDRADMPRYLIMDGRARLGPQYMERATVLVMEDSLRLVRRIVNSDTYGDAVVVETATMAVVYDPHPEYAADPDVRRCWP